jgi:hypothetical protein
MMDLRMNALGDLIALLLGRASILGWGWVAGCGAAVIVLFIFFAVTSNSTNTTKRNDLEE